MAENLSPPPWLTSGAIPIPRPSGLDYTVTTNTVQVSSFAIPAAAQGATATIRFTTGDIADEDFDSGVVLDKVKVLAQ
jgi:hypothetical protein